jgi:hypothetical protein
LQFLTSGGAVIMRISTNWSVTFDCSVCRLNWNSVLQFVFQKLHITTLRQLYVKIVGRTLNRSWFCGREIYIFVPIFPIAIFLCRYHDVVVIFRYYISILQHELNKFVQLTTYIMDFTMESAIILIYFDPFSFESKEQNRQIWDRSICSICHVFTD